MRSRKALISTLSGISYELVSAICGFIVPRLILGAFGSAYNGITSSITQFLSCVVLFKTGIAGVTRAALYKPLSEKNERDISGIFNATQQFMRKIALIYAVSTVVFSAIYPFLVQEEFSWGFSASLVLVLGLSHFVQYYFGMTWQILLEADQRHAFIYLVQIITTVMNTLIAAVLIRMGATIHVVKLGSALAFCINPLLINWFARRRFKIDRSAAPDRNAIKQRWDAFGQAAAAFVHNNTDVVVLTLFSNIYEVSVYTVYYMVCNGLKTLLKTFTSSVGAAFGNMLAKGEASVMQKNMDIFEYVVTSMTTLFFTVAGVMMLPFVGVYTHNVTDVNYLRPGFSILMVVGMALFCYRIPYQAVIEAAGHYRQTRKGALLEAAVNIVVSVITVFRWGLIGVAIGTLVANLIRTVNYVGYLHRHILHRSYWLFIRQMATSAGIAGLTVLLSRSLGLIQAHNYFDFFGYALLCALICAALTLAVSLLFYRSTLKALIKMFRRAVKHGSDRKT